MPDELNKKLREKYENIITTNGNKLTRKNAIITNDENKINAHKKNINKIMEINLLNRDIKDKMFELKEQMRLLYEEKAKKNKILLFCQNAKDKFSKMMNKNPENLQIKKEMYDIVNPSFYYQELGSKIIQIYLSNDLLRLANPVLDGPLLSDIAQLRASLVKSIGYIIPNIATSDEYYADELFGKYQYSILIRGQEVFKGYVSEENIKKNNSEEIIKNLKDVCIKYVHQIMTRSDALKIMELVKSEEPTLVNDLIPTFLSSTDIKKILANLIHDGFSIKDILFIFEQLNDHARYTQDTDELTEIIKNELMFYLN